MLFQTRVSISDHWVLLDLCKVNTVKNRNITINVPRIESSIYFSNSTVNISWIVPRDLLLECIDFIIITNASAPSSTTNSSVLITRPVESSVNATYIASIAAMDKAGRTGEQSETPCFSFECEHKTVVYSCNEHIGYPYSWRNGGIAASYR